MSFPLQNAGWGPMSECRIDFELFDSQYPEERIAGPLSLPLGNIETRLPEGFLEPTFAQLGVDENNYGPFASGIALLAGELVYTAEGKDGEMREQSNPFTAQVEIGQ